MQTQFKTFVIRDWQPNDRQTVANLIALVLTEYGLKWEPQLADQDVIEIEQSYLQKGGAFWVIEQQGQIVGTAAYRPFVKSTAPQLERTRAEIRKMYLLPEARGQGLGTFLLQQLEAAIKSQGFQEIYLETARVMQAAVALYEHNGYQSASDIETKRCDLAYQKPI
jgi:putative acetyltransferase